MKKFLLIFFALVSVPLFSQSNAVIIKIKGQYALQAANPDSNATGLEPVNTILNDNHFTSIKRIKTGKKSQEVIFRIEFPENVDIVGIIEKFKQSGVTEYAEPDFTGSGGGVMATTVNDMHYSRQWGLTNDGSFQLYGATEGADVEMEAAWDIEQGSSDIIVAVMDSGLRLNHPEFAGRLWTNPGEIPGNGIDDDGNGYVDDTNGWDYANSDNIPNDDHGHGTNVTGIIAANSDNGIGYTGVDRNCKVMVLKGLDSGNFGQYSWWAEAITYATDNGAKVINLSVGGNSFSALLQSAINYALSNNVIVVACMMNTNNSVNYYPARFNGVIAVGATNPDDTRSSPFFWSSTSGSNFGSHISVVAPGNFIYGLSHLSNTDYDSYWGGTSQATPLVAGIASLLLAQDNTRTPAQIKAILEQTAEDQVGDAAEDTQGFDIYHGHGRVNAFNALSSSLSTKEIKPESRIAIYPNPSTGILHVNTLEYPAKATVHTTLGQVVSEKQLLATDSEIFIPKAGVYVVTITGISATHTQTIIIQ